MTAARTALVVTPTLGRGGAERHTVGVAVGLDRSRWIPHVLTMTDGPLRRDLEAAGVEVTVAGTGHGLRSLPAATRAVAAAVEAIGPAVISVHDVLGELAVRAAVHRRPCPLLVWKHTYGHIGYRGHRDRTVERFSGRLVTRYGAVCHTQVRYLTDDLGVDPRRVRVVTNTVPAGEALPLPAGPPRVAMVAAMRADKGHADALNAWRTVVARCPGARLLLIGNGPLRPGLEALVLSLGLQNDVEFLGEIASPADVVATTHAVLVASWSIECFPYAALEAMALGRAVVSTDVGGMPEMVDDGVSGLLVPPHDPDALAAALLDVVCNPRRARTLGAAAHERLARVFPYDRWLEQITDLFDETATASPVADVRTSR